MGDKNIEGISLMTNEERLKNIRKLWYENNDPCEPDDYEWLIEQAKRAKESEEGGRFFEQGYRQLEEQNERYKQALEDIRSSVTWGDANEASFKAYQTADRALRGDTE